jgi:hypothetical protein
VEAALEAEGGGDCRHRYDARTEEGTGTAGDLEETMASIQAILGVGGLIHVAVGLSGGVGVLLTKRSGYSRNA